MSILWDQSCFNVTLLFSSILVLIFIVKNFKQSFHTRKLNLPPSPPNKLPIIGHLHQLSSLPHYEFQKMAEKLGPIMMLFLGSSPTLVVSSAEGATEIMKTQDINFSNRPKQAFPKRLFYDKDVAFMPYCEYWRQIRRICILQLLSVKRVQSFRSVREEETEVLVQKITSAAKTSQPVDLTSFLVTLTSDITCRVSFGKKYSGEEIGKRFGDILTEQVYLLGVFNVGDFIPWLSWVNRINGLYGRVEKCFKEMDVFLDEVIADHVVSKKKRESAAPDPEYKPDLVDVLLGINSKDSNEVLNVDGSLDDDSIKAVILDVFAAGTDTSHAVLEWAMTELMRHPKAMKRVQEEVREVMKGKDKITEEDMERMEYMQCVIKETLRLHLPGPLLIARESIKDCKVFGYDIPAKTRVLVNVHTIGRDPTIWKEPNEFMPERFINSSIDYKGQTFEFTPFGAGRRGCPGITFAIANIQLVLSNLLVRFDWNWPVGGDAGTDMAEMAGLVVHKKNPVVLVPSIH